MAIYISDCLFYSYSCLIISRETVLHLVDNPIKCSVWISWLLCFIQTQMTTEMQSERRVAGRHNHLLNKSTWFDITPWEAKCTSVQCRRVRVLSQTSLRLFSFYFWAKTLSQWINKSSNRKVISSYFDHSCKWARELHSFHFFSFLVRRICLFVLVSI